MTVETETIVSLPSSRLIAWIESSVATHKVHRDILSVHPSLEHQRWWCTVSQNRRATTPRKDLDIVSNKRPSSWKEFSLPTPQRDLSASKIFGDILRLVNSNRSSLMENIEGRNFPRLSKFSFRLEEEKIRRPRGNATRWVTTWHNEDLQLQQATNYTLQLFINYDNDDFTYRGVA